MMQRQTSLRPTPRPNGDLPPLCAADVGDLRRHIRFLVTKAPRSPARDPESFTDVLLTGATGFIGRFVLRDLLAQKVELTVHCLVRAENPEHGLERIRAALEDADLWDEQASSRIRAVPGDIGQSNFGLGQEEFDTLCATLDAVYHFAADLKLAASYASVRRVNTVSIKTALDLCFLARRKPLYFASSMGVFPEYFCRFAREFAGREITDGMEPNLADMKRIFPPGLVGYPWSKLVVERSLLFAESVGLPVGIFRLPQTGMSSSGFTQAGDLSVRLFSAAVDIEAVPPGLRPELNNEPVDVLSKACVAISLNGRRTTSVYHCCDPQPHEFSLEFADCGLYFRRVSYRAFKRACQRRGEASPLHGHWTPVDHFAPYWFSDEPRRSAMPVSDRAFRRDCPHAIVWPGTMTRISRSDAWIRARGDRWPHPLAQARLDADGLVERAHAYADEAGVSFDTAYPNWLIQAMRQLVEELAGKEARLVDSKIGMVAADLSRKLRTHASLAAALERSPEIADETVARPVFIIGINRSGTTYLHRLMSRDPRFCVLRSYELVEPVIPPSVDPDLLGTYRDPRRLVWADLVEASGVLEVFEGVHLLAEDEAEEDFPLLGQAFTAWMIPTRFRAPRYLEWLSAEGSREAYGHHRAVMQYLTHMRHQVQPGRDVQWLCKMPFHLKELDTLSTTYPDALFIQTHREPTQLMGSWCSLVERIRSLSMHPQPPHTTGAEQLAFMSGMLNEAMAFREAHPELESRWMDVNFFDLIQEPMTIIGRIYDFFDWRLDEVTEWIMEDWMIEQSQRRRKWKHRYRLSDYGLTTKGVTEAFAPYREFITRRGLWQSQL